MNQPFSARGQWINGLRSHFDDHVLQLQDILPMLGNAATAYTEGARLNVRPIFEGEHAVADPGEFGGTPSTPAGAVRIASGPPAPWAAGMTADWNNAVHGRAADAITVSDQLIRLNAIMVRFLNETESADSELGVKLTDHGKKVRLDWLSNLKPE
ncbi:hypothetical protein LX16_2711 [Stackebrandtia albiflava]|uniref:Uncharacterized protein n=1 Tax=Stackebrandtia albiflava TaxID=406432 RepID=A0A562V263_9ACTN|nr:hypothetical protein [Stackebrandtia albiflava]TWJ11968.1 hypothetical protein LX16_2711 [Stackebrandtia albiflava]